LGPFFIEVGGDQFDKARFSTLIKGDDVEEFERVKIVLCTDP